MLRRNKVLEKDMNLYDQDSINEMGHLSLVYKLKIENFEDQVYEDVREIEKYYYDPFNNNEHDIQKVTSTIINGVELKQNIRDCKEEA